ncbi:hypothetical protein [Allorhizocola rhizosphaerae]|uniref:hypothetical protein n=1 Tax=Allorhizocola rhizosphaerae TaxID=1872709 RepID=UPI0013C2DB9C|nr:hypothetical protein [Allorhizocola rhizosphaerae]
MIAVYRIPLHVTGVDLDDERVLDILDRRLNDLSWAEVSGRVIATLHTDCDDPVGQVMQVLRSIRNLLGANVVEVDQDLVNISGIAHRVGVTREAVRTWVEGIRGPGNFPEHVGATGADQGSQRIWRWADVSNWLHSSFQLGDDEDHLSRQQLAAVNAAIQGVPEALDRQWESLGSVFEKELRVAPDRSSRHVKVGERLPAHVKAKIRRALQDRQLARAAIKPIEVSVSAERRSEHHGQ